MIHYIGSSIIIDGDLDVEVVEDSGDSIFSPRLFKLINPVYLYIGSIKYNVPCGFIFDFASIPRILKPFFSDRTVYGYAAMVHDWLYKSGVVSRKEADKLLFIILKEDHTWMINRELIYGAVRLFGWYAWNGHRHNK